MLVRILWKNYYPSTIYRFRNTNFTNFSRTWYGSWVASNTMTQLFSHLPLIRRGSILSRLSTTITIYPYRGKKCSITLFNMLSHTLNFTNCESIILLFFDNSVLRNQAFLSVTRTFPVYQRVFFSSMRRKRSTLAGESAAT